jgi:hypothetical protein
LAAPEELLLPAVFEYSAAFYPPKIKRNKKNYIPYKGWMSIIRPK